MTKSFKQFIYEEKTLDGYKVIQDIIHFRKYPGLSENVHKSYKNPQKLSDENGEGDHEKLSEKLSAATLKDTDKESLNHFKRYSSGNARSGNRSASLNKALIKNKPLSNADQKIHDSIMKHAKPSGHEFHTFSGVSTDFGKLAKESKDHILHSPAHISTSHSVEEAQHFSEKHSDGFYHHIHIHIKPHDKILHISSVSEKPHEHETIIPAGTKLKYHGTTKHDDIDKFHHFTIHHD